MRTDEIIYVTDEKLNKNEKRTFEGIGSGSRIDGVFCVRVCVKGVGKGRVKSSDGASVVVARMCRRRTASDGSSSWSAGQKTGKKT